MEREFSRKIFEKYSNIIFHEKPSVGAELFYSEGRTDRHEAANSRFHSFA